MKWGKPVVSKLWIDEMPDRPARTAAAKSSAPRPRLLTAPRPVTTTRQFGSVMGHRRRGITTYHGIDLPEGCHAGEFTLGNIQAHFEFDSRQYLDRRE